MLNAWIQSLGEDLGGGANVKNRLFLDYGHVAYQSKADDACSNIVASILPTDTPSTRGWAQKVKPFISESSHVAYQIKEN